MERVLCIFLGVEFPNTAASDRGAGMRGELTCGTGGQVNNIRRNEVVTWHSALARDEIMCMNSTVWRYHRAASVDSELEFIFDTQKLQLHLIQYGYQ